MDEVGSGPVALDTAPVLYFIESHATFAPILRPLFQAVAGGHVEAVTSALTLLEVLVVPYRAGDLALAQRYEVLLTRAQGVHLADLGLPMLRAAAQLRAVTRVRTPDSLQLAAALAHRCTAFITNDRRIPSLPGLRVLQLSDFV